MAAKRWWCARSCGLPPAGTFHGVAQRMLHAHLHRLPDCGRTSDFNIHDTDDNVSMLMDWVRDGRKARSGQAGEDIKMKVLTLFRVSAHRAIDARLCSELSSIFNLKHPSQLARIFSEAVA